MQFVMSTPKNRNPIVVFSVNYAFSDHQSMINVIRNATVITTREGTRGFRNSGMVSIVGDCPVFLPYTYPTNTTSLTLAQALQEPPETNPINNWPDLFAQQDLVLGILPRPTYSGPIIRYIPARYIRTTSNVSNLAVTVGCVVRAWNWQAGNIQSASYSVGSGRLTANSGQNILAAGDITMNTNLAGFGGCGLSNQSFSGSNMVAMNYAGYANVVANCPQFSTQYSNHEITRGAPVCAFQWDGTKYAKFGPEQMTYSTHSQNVLHDLVIAPHNVSYRLEV